MLRDDTVTTRRNALLVSNELRSNELQFSPFSPSRIGARRPTRAHFRLSTFRERDTRRFDRVLYLSNVGAMPPNAGRRERNARAAPCRHKEP